MYVVQDLLDICLCKGGFQGMFWSKPLYRRDILNDGPVHGTWWLTSLMNVCRMHSVPKNFKAQICFWCGFAAAIYEPYSRNTAASACPVRYVWGLQYVFCISHCNKWQYSLEASSFLSRSSIMYFVIWPMCMRQRESLPNINSQYWPIMCLNMSSVTTASNPLIRRLRECSDIKKIRWDRYEFKSLRDIRIEVQY